jgi:exoribonuclease R
MDDENVPVEHNIFDSSPAHELMEELSHKANFFVARKLLAAMPDKAFLRRQLSPNPRRLQTFVERMSNIGYDIDPTSSGSLQCSLFKVKDPEIRKVRTSCFNPPFFSFLVFLPHFPSPCVLFLVAFHFPFKIPLNMI